MMDFIAVGYWGFGFAAGVAVAEVSVEEVVGQAAAEFLEIHGVRAGAMDPAIWRAGRLHFLHDRQSPLLSPRLSGAFRNIYAPSAVEVPGGWRLFYGAWDGVETGNDRIYSVNTTDFVDFGERTTVIEHGDFIHVCNVNAVRLPDGAYHMMCTVYPDKDKLNKPAAFHSPDGRTWNGSEAPHEATFEDIIDIEGYAKYAEADINGVNVILHEAGTYRLYFNNWKDAGQVYRASGKDGKRFRFEGVSLKTSHAVNDMKKFDVGGEAFYLMGLHRNADRLWYAWSGDGMRFEGERELGMHLDETDRYIVAIGWVVQGDRLLGYCYGAGAVRELNRNRIFARWLQKKVVFVDEDGGRHEPTRALGPDCQMIPLGQGKAMSGHFEVFAEDGERLVGKSKGIKVHEGRVYRVGVD
jgi:hypothetical protein